MYVSELIQRTSIDLGSLSQDGILGICAGVEMLRVLEEENIDHEYPIGVINWTK